MTQQALDVQTRLFLLRHGEVDWTRVVGGEPPLSAAGIATAEMAAATLPRFDCLAASPQRPAREAAETIGLVRGIAQWWQEDLEEIRTVMPLADAGAYAAWLDRLFESYDTSADGESLADGAARMAAALRRIGDRFHGRTTLVVSHPVILLAFRANQSATPLSRDQVQAMPDLALATLDYLEGRFYIVQDFPIRWTAHQVDG